MKTLLSNNIRAPFKRSNSAIIASALLVTLSMSAPIAVSAESSSTVQLVIGCKGTAFMRLQALVDQIAGTTSTTTGSGGTTICHVSKLRGEPDVTITVDDASLLPAHFAHSDLEGICGTAASVVLVTADLAGSDELADCLLPTDTKGALSTHGGNGSLVETGRQSWLENR